MDMKQVNIPKCIWKSSGSILTLQICCITFWNPKELKKLKEMKKDDTVRNLFESKFDRETLAVLLVSIKEIPEILQRCNYSDLLLKPNDLQIMDAISGCYEEEYKILKKKI
jgi:hypothetical protein